MQIGDRVEVITDDFYHPRGEKGTIIKINPHDIFLVEFDNPNERFHDGFENDGKPKHCWYFSAGQTTVKVFEKAKSLSYRIDAAGFRTNDALWAKGLSLL
jgi:hypothetical protein